MAKLVLVDGSSYLFRAFHALPPLTNSKGNPTGAAYGVVNMLKKLVEQTEPDFLGVVFDAPGKTFRDDMYELYKANRESMPDDLRVQIEPLHEIVKALGYPLIVESGVEADDVIGTLAKTASEAGHEVLISTGDKDMAQLVNDKVTLINTMTNKVMDTEAVVEKFGVRPDQIIDWLALVGDSVDNIPGVPKCGPKTATKWLGQFENVEGVMAAAPDMGGKIGEHLRGALEQLPLSYALATIKLDVELPELEGLCQQTEPEWEKLVDLYKEMEFKTWLREALEASQGDELPDFGLVAQDANGEAVATEAAPLPVADGDYDIIFDQAELDAWVAKLEGAELVAFDTETNSLDYMQAEIIGVSFAVEAGKAAYVPLAHDYEGAPQQLDRDAVLTQLKPSLENADVKKVGQHLKYDMHVLENHGIGLQGFEHDTMLQSYVLNAGGGRHDMDTLALKYLGRTTVKFETIAGKGKAQKTFNQIEIDTAGPYAAEDADVTLQLHQQLWPQLQAEPGMRRVYEELELPLAPVLERIEHTGVNIDSHILLEHSAEIVDKLAAIERKAFEEAGCEFNLSSPKQLQEILFEKQGIPVIRKTPKGQPSTAEDVLQELAHDYALPALIIEHRGLSKLKSTYTDKLPQQVDADTGRVHTSYNQTVAATGRLSSTDPNLQNIPIRTEEGRRVRQAFVPEDGYKMVAVDYSQIELRIMAHLSGDQSLLDAFAEGRDIHAATAAEVFGLPVDEVPTERRRAAKAINFGLIYGMSAFGLAKQLGVGRGEAQEYIDLYFDRYPGVKRYMDETRQGAHDTGYVETLMGRRLYLPEINSRNGARRQYAERTAINAPMQGTAADIIKRAMIDVDAWLPNSGYDCKMIMQVHDELVFEIKADQVDAATAEIQKIMESAADLNVPLVAEAGVGINWDEAH
ncbi:MAG: DNA polymerase I [Gammaproteobacteria bacterium]|nr:DNA polymerase I [Gammaproteobacteria bacterium]